MDVESTRHFIDKWFVPLLLSAVAVLAPIHSLIVAVGVLVFGDAVLAVWAAIKTGKPVTSARLMDSVVKMFVYSATVVLTFVVETYMLHGFIPIVKMISCAIGFVEIVSILENAGLILGQPVFKVVINKLGSKNRNHPKGE